MNETAQKFQYYKTQLGVAKMTHLIAHLVRQNCEPKNFFYLLDNFPHLSIYLSLQPFFQGAVTKELHISIETDNQDLRLTVSTKYHFVPQIETVFPNDGLKLFHTSSLCPLNRGSTLIAKLMNYFQKQDVKDVSAYLVQKPFILV